MVNYKSLPDTPGVYIMKGADGRVLYVGKAGNLRRRVSSYFERPHDVRIETLVRKIKKIAHRKTDTALEALILEARLIKSLMPPFNVREKDDKSFLYFRITKEKFPRVLLVRGKDAAGGKTFGPFTSASNAREALRILRKIFPWNTHEPERIGTFKRPCFDYEIGLCPGTCIGTVTVAEYRKTVGRLTLFFEGKKKAVLRTLQKDMAVASKALEFEKAEKFRRQIFALRHIRDTALISDSPVLAERGSMQGMGGGANGAYRIEGYDISDISGTSAVGSMVVFEDGEPNKNEYRKFRIRTVFQPNDVGMLTEVLTRRFKRHDWPMPDLVLIDGGVAQASAARRVLLRARLRIPIISIVKGPERKRNDVIGAVPKGVQKATLIRVRDEAHRFAIKYHKTLRGRRAFE